MPLMAVMQGSGLTTSASHPYCLFIDGLDVIKQPGTPGTLFGTDIDSIVLTEQRGQSPTLEFTIDDPGGALTIRNDADVYFCDHRGRRHTDGTFATDDRFRGFVMSVTKLPLSGGVQFQWHVVAIGLDALLDRKVFTSGILDRSLIPDTGSAIQYVASQLGDGRLSALAVEPNALSVSDTGRLIYISGAFILNASISMTGKTPRQVFAELSAGANATDNFYLGDLRDIVDVDNQGRIRWLHDDTTGSTGLEPIREGTNATTPAPSNIQAQTDMSSHINAVYVRGVDATSSTWVTDDSNILLYGRFEAYIEAGWATSALAASSAGRQFLSQHKPISRLSFTLGPDAHDNFIPVPPDNMHGWNTGRRAQLTSTSGYWTNTTYYLHEIVWHFSGGGTVLTLDLGFAGGQSRGTSMIATQSAAQEAQVRSAARLTGGLGEVAVRAKAGVPADTDFDIARDGFMVIDTTDNALWIRSGGAWKPSPFSYGSRVTIAAASASLTLATGAPADVVGATITATALSAETWLVIGVFDFTCSVAGTNIGQGFMAFDGAAQTAEAHNTGTSVTRETTTQMWTVSAAAGSHTVKLQGAKTVADGNHAITLTHTRIILIQLPA